ncbi:hypothetical protein JQ628_16500 [Bradyrhizobium lablabi]|uniref:hypothetical protein n=1 Tax=Bradyrhizobium lablabi TaxID=722472 RepID=UPI001BA53AD9|nr:hypothetical protein [Bradyrhizobium lablabi]MBR1123129.1 hypothetical protein [Bradyrhizobium lablabi]
MAEFLWSTVGLILKAVDFVLDMTIFISRLRFLARAWTGSDRLVAVPADPKALSPAARRALAEAERRRDGASFIDKYVREASR